MDISTRTPSAQRVKRALGYLLAAAFVVGAPAMAQNHGRQGGGGGAAAMPHPTEPMRAPNGYRRVERPSGAENRAPSLDCGAYNHNFAADRAYHIGPYHPPRNYRYRQWYYGEFLPGIYWGQQFWLQDFWLFWLEVPPVGYEWVRYGPDALLVDVTTGEVIQSVYGVFG